MLVKTESVDMTWVVVVGGAQMGEGGGRGWGRVFSFSFCQTVSKVAERENTQDSLLRRRLRWR